MARLHGFRDLVYSILTDDTASGAVYGPVYSLPGAVSCDVAANDGEPYVIQSDDIEKERIQQEKKSRLSFEIDMLPKADEARIFGRSIDAYGVIVKKRGDTPPYIAIGFKCAYTNNVDAYIWFLKTSVLPDGMSAKSRERGTIAPVTKKLEFDAIERNYDGGFEEHVLSDDVAFATKKATFFDTPYEASIAPDITISGQPVDKAVTEGAIAGTLGVTASVSGGGTATYQWYQNDERSTNGASAVAGATTATLTIPTGLADGNHYFYCVVSAEGAVSVTSDIVVVVVLAA